MSRNALSVQQQALAYWIREHGDESLYMQCQRFDGYYAEWAYRGTEDGIHIYPTAQAAANASTMFTKDVNHPSVKPGNLIYWKSGTDGHVATVIGRDAAGRTLVTHTGARGQDVVLDLGQSVVVSHADSIDRTVIGVSLTNGRNGQRTGLTGWNPDADGGASWAFNQPSTDVQARIQQALKNRGRYSGPVDGVWGPNTIKGIQATAANVGYDGPIDGAPGPNTCYYVQVYAQRFGDYAGPIDRVLGPNGWAAFALGLERP